MPLFYPPPRISDPDMHHGTCVTHVPWCMRRSLISGFLWSRWRGKRSRHSRRMRNPQFYVSGRRPIGVLWNLWDWLIITGCIFLFTVRNPWLRQQGTSDSWDPEVEEAGPKPFTVCPGAQRYRRIRLRLCAPKLCPSRVWYICSRETVSGETQVCVEFPDIT